jgi:RimJ/RimL family protein N-acetyltransferase
MNDAVNHKDLSLKPVVSEDCQLIWKWANDPLTRKFSFSSAPIPWEEHVAWFQTKLTDRQCIFHIVQRGSKPIGQIRFQIEGKEAIISVSIAPDQRGRGFSSQIIRLGSINLFYTTSVKVINAFIKHGNVASERAFSKAGYIMDGSTTIMGSEASHFVLSKDSGS